MRPTRTPATVMRNCFTRALLFDQQPATHNPQPGAGSQKPRRLGLIDK
jgi:hypothetical protein